MPCNPQPAQAELNSLTRGRPLGPVPLQAALTARSCAVSACEPGQVRKEAALSGSRHVMQASLARAKSSGHAREPRLEDGCTVPIRSPRRRRGSSTRPPPDEAASRQVPFDTRRSSSRVCSRRCRSAGSTPSVPKRAGDRVALGDRQLGEQVLGDALVLVRGRGCARPREAVGPGESRSRRPGVPRRSATLAADDRCTATISRACAASGSQ